MWRIYGYFPVQQNIPCFRNGFSFPILIYNEKPSCSVASFQYLFSIPLKVHSTIHAFNSFAFIATIPVLKPMNTAPIAGPITTSQGARTPAAKGKEKYYNRLPTISFAPVSGRSFSKGRSMKPYHSGCF